MSIQKKLNVCAAGVVMVSVALTMTAAQAATGRLDEVQTILNRNMAVRTTMAKGPGLKHGAAVFGSGAIRASAWGEPDAYRLMMERDDCFFDIGRAGKTKEGRQYHTYWKLDPLIAGELRFDVPALKGAVCRQEQDIYRAEVRLQAGGGDHALLIVSKALRTNPDLMLTTLRNTGKQTLAVRLASYALPSDDPVSLEIDRFAGVRNDTLWTSRKSHPGALKHSAWIGLATRLFGAPDAALTHNEDTAAASFSLPPGSTVTVLTAVTSTALPLTSTPADPIPAALELAARATPAKLAEMEQAHQTSWDAYWLRSFITIPCQPKMERYYYGSLYALGCTHRFDNSGWSPGLYGWSTYDTQAAGWAASYTLNYNLEATYYGVYSANRAELDEAYWRVIQPLIESWGFKEAKKKGYPGIIMPGGVGVGGAVIHNNCNMLSNNAEIALPLIDHWFYTYDTEFLKKVYPYFRLAADFSDAFFVREPSGRYVITQPIWESLNQQKFNCANALALFKRFYVGLLAASEALDLDADRRAKWRDILEHMADFPTIVQNGKTIYSYAEDQKPDDWEKSSFPIGAAMTLPLYPVFPAQLVTPGSDPQMLQRYRDTLRECGKRWWTQPNSFVHTPVQAVRMGYDFAEIKERFNRWLDHQMKPNNIVTQGGGYFECVGGIEAINSMLLQSADGVLRLFPNWDGSDASFHQLRAVGAFLISASLKNGTVAELTIASEKGRACRVMNPWPGKPVTVRTADGKSVPVVVKECVVEFSTVPGGRYVLTAQ